MINELSIKVIKAIKEHVSSGYYKETQKMSGNAVIDAISVGKIRLTKIEDLDSSFDDLAGDCFNPKANPDVCPQLLSRQRHAFKSRISRSGVWGMCSEYWTGREWESLEGIDDNSIFGFVGNDFFGSGYELQIMESALDAYNSQALDKDGFVIDPFRKAG